MHDKDGRQLALRFRRLHQIAFHGSIALGRRIFDELSNNARIVLGDLLGLCEARVQRLQQGARADAAGGEFLRAVEKAATVGQAMHIAVEQL